MKSHYHKNNCFYYIILYLMVFTTANTANAQDCDQPITCDWVTLLYDGFENQGVPIDGVIEGTTGNPTVHTVFPQGDFSGPTVFHGKARTGEGYMYMNFQSLSPPTICYSRTIDVCPFAEVRMSFWYRDLQPNNVGHSNMINVYDGSDNTSPILFSGIESSTATQSVYTLFETGTFIPTGTTITFELESLLPKDGAGNDFIMDDLLFEQCDPEPIPLSVDICESSDIDLYNFIQECIGDDGEWTGDEALEGGYLGTFNTDNNDLGTFTYTSGCLEYDITVNAVEYSISADYLYGSLCDDETQLITINVEPSGGNYDVLWGDNEIHDSRELGPGIFDIIVTDLDNGCEITETIEVQPLYPDETYTTVLICEGESIDIFDSGVEESVEGSYDHFTTNQYGCDSTIIANLQIVKLEINPTVSGMLNCDVNSVDLSSTFGVTGVTLNYDNIIIEWELPDGAMETGQNITSSQEGMHYITFTVDYIDGTICSIVDSVEVLGNSNVPSFTSLEDISIDCNSTENAIFRPMTEAGNIITWTNNNGLTSNADTLLVTMTDTIYMEIINPSSGCIVYDTVMVMVDNDIPDLSIEGNNIDCDIISADLSSTTEAQNITYSWSFNNGEIGDQPDITVSEAGTYTLTITDDNDCSISRNYDVVVDTLSPQLELSDATIACDTDEIIITTSVPPDHMITWNNDSGSLGSNDSITTDIGGIYTVVLVNTLNHCETTETFNITDLGDSPELSLPTGSLNCISDEVSLTVSSDQNDVSYTWTFEATNISNTDNTIATQGGEYIITATSATGCITMDTVTIDTNYTTPTVSLHTDDELDCAVTSASIETTVSDGDTFAWTGPDGYTDNNMSVDVNNAGWYYIEVTNSISGCIMIDSIEIISNVTLPDVTVSDRLIDCNITSFDADLFVDGTYSTIEWTGPDGFQASVLNPTITQSGEYNVIVTLENGCKIERNMTVSDDTTPPTFEYNAGIIDCDVSTASVEVTTESTATLLITAPNGDTYDTATFQASESGTYNVVITGENGCVTTTILEVEESMDAPSLTLEGGTMLDCSTEELLLEISSDLTGITDISWTLNNVEITTSENYTASSPGEYIVTITAENGCTTTENITIIQDITDPVIAIVDPEILDCIVQTIPLTSTSDGGSYNYAWTGPDDFTANSIETSTNIPGMYFLTATGSNGCTTTIATEVIQIINEINVLADGNDLDCIVDFSTLTFDSDSEYSTISWLGPQGSNDQETWLVSTPGSYTITLTDEYGCEGESSIEITDTSEQPEINMISPDTIFLGVYEVGVIDMEVLDATDYIIEWMPQEGLSCYDCLRPHYTGEGETDYTVTVTSASGCVDIDNIFIRRDIGPVIGIPNIITKNDSYNNLFTLYGNESVFGIKEFLIYDRWGELVFSVENIPHSSPEYGWDGTFNGEDVVPGVYVYYFLIDTNLGDQKRVGDITVMD